MRAVPPNAKVKPSYIDLGGYFPLYNHDMSRHQSAIPKGEKKSLYTICDIYPREDTSSAYKITHLIVNKIFLVYIAGWSSLESRLRQEVKELEGGHITDGGVGNGGTSPLKSHRRVRDDESERKSRQQAVKKRLEVYCIHHRHDQ